jgi:hypothetical protein
MEITGARTCAAAELVLQLEGDWDPPMTCKAMAGPRAKFLWAHFQTRDFSKSSPVACEYRRGWLQFTCKPEPMVSPLDLTMVKLAC